MCRIRESSNIRPNPIDACRACAVRELAVTTYCETIGALEAGHRADLAHCGELIAAAVEALHRAHVRARSREQQYARLLEECRVLRLLVRGQARPWRAA